MSLLFIYSLYLDRLDTYFVQQQSDTSQHRGADRRVHVQNVKRMSHQLSSNVLCVH